MYSKGFLFKTEKKMIKTLSALTWTDLNTSTELFTSPQSRKSLEPSFEINDKLLSECPNSITQREIQCAPADFHLSYSELSGITPDPGFNSTKHTE